MINLLGLDLKNVGVFEDVSVDFNANVTWVRGHNHDSDPTNPTSNGVGKSYLFSAIATLFYQAAPLSVKKNDKKTLLSAKSSSTGIFMVPYKDGPEYEIIQTPSKYYIYKDGEDQQVRTVPEAEKMIAQLFPLTEAEFYTRVFVTTQRPHPLQHAKDIDRLQVMSDLANLANYDELKKHFLKVARTISDDTIKVQTLEGRLISARKKLEDCPKPYTSAKPSDLRKRAKTLQAKLSSNREVELEHTKNLHVLESLLALEKQLDSLRAEYSSSLPPEKYLKQLKQLQKQVQEYQQYKLNRQTLKRQIVKIENSLASDSDFEKYKKFRLKDAQAELDSIKEHLRNTKAELEDLLDAKQQLEDYAESIENVSSRLKKILNKFDKSMSDLPKRSEVMSMLENAKSTLRLADLLHSHGSSGTTECPTCLSPVNLKKIAKAVEDANEIVDTMNAYKKAHDLYEDYTALQKDKPDVEYDEDLEVKLLSRIDSLNKDEKNIRKCMSVLSAHAESIGKLNSLKDQLAELEVVENPDADIDDLDGAMESCTNILQKLYAKDTLLKKNPEYADFKRVAKVEHHLKSVQSSLNQVLSENAALQVELAEIGTTLTDYELAASNHAMLSSEVSELEEAVAKLKPSIRRKKLVDILIKAYGSKGIKARRVDNICKLFETNLNHYRHFIFNEPFEFKVVATEKGVSIMVDRNNGRKDSVTDVRLLSGAESNQFQALCALAILPLTPENRRVNLMIFDEPTSHMDEVSRNVFVTKYLAVLRELVPHIYVITPHQSDQCPNAAEWLVEKRNGRSKLLEHKL